MNTSANEVSNGTAKRSGLECIVQSRSPAAAKRYELSLWTPHSQVICPQLRTFRLFVLHIAVKQKRHSNIVKFLHECIGASIRV